MGVDFSSVDQVHARRNSARSQPCAYSVSDEAGTGWMGSRKVRSCLLSLPDLVECVALREAAREGRLDALRVPGAPLDVLAQVLLRMSIEGEWSSTTPSPL